MKNILAFIVVPLVCLLVSTYIVIVSGDTVGSFTNTNIFTILVAILFSAASFAITFALTKNKNKALISSGIYLLMLFLLVVYTTVNTPSPEGKTTK